MHLRVAEAGFTVVAAAGIVSSLLHGVPAGTWVPGLFLLLKGVAFFYLVCMLPIGRDDVVHAGSVVLAASAMLLLVGAAFSTSRAFNRC